MSRPRSSVPRYLHHKATGRAFVFVRGENDARKPVYLGPYGSSESKRAYARIVAGCQAGQTPQAAAVVGTEPTIADLVIEFMKHAAKHYRRPDGTTTNELVEYRCSFRPLADLYSDTPARQFGPRALKAVRAKMVESGLARKVVNARVSRIRRMFKWAVSDELVGEEVAAALLSVAGLQKGRSDAPECEPVEPVADVDVEATIPHLTVVVAAMVRFQRLTACRPQDVCNIRGDETDRSGDVWVYRPGQHKTAWRGMIREVWIGPRAQAVIAPFLCRAGDGYLFSPAESKAEFMTTRRAARTSPLWPSHVRRYEEARKKHPRRAPGRRFTTGSYIGAIERGCEKARVPVWTPNRLRHSAGTEIRERYGLDGAQVVLGHSKADVTELYAEKSAALAARIAREVG